jgi:predicted ribosome quality control (RQC) complex YloA/Tae2 family protein
MPLDTFFLTALKNELAGRITGMKIEKIQQPEHDQVILTLRGFGASPRLLISAGTGDARVHLTDAAFENPQNPPMFCMLLRKHLAGARIKSVTQPTLERALDFCLDCLDALGEPCDKHLIVELMGRYSNIILTARDGLIIDCLKRVDALMSELRQVLPGLYYRQPPSQKKRDPLHITREEFSALLKGSSAEITAEKLLLDTFTGLSPLICRELVYRAYGDTEARMAQILSKDGGAALCDEMLGLAGEINAGRFGAYMLADADGKPRDFSYTPICQYGSMLKLEKSESFSSLLDEFYTRRGAAERMRQRSQALTKTIKNTHDRLLRKLENQRGELKETLGRERLREFGDMITANMHAIKKGMSVFRTTDYYSEDGREVEIRLDPLKTPQQNAAKYYKDYTKAKNAEIIMKEQIALGEGELDYLKSVLEEIARAESERDLIEIRRELAQTGYVKPQKTEKKEKPPQSQPVRFQSSTGFTILVGRNNIQNETLTHKTAFKTDIWLHAQKIPGSHVIVSTNGRSPDDATLNEAAALAAYYSQARESKKVPVDYTLVKHVKKIPGGRPGMVTYTDYKTIIAEPSEELVKRLKGN